MGIIIIKTIKNNYIHIKKFKKSNNFYNKNSNNVNIKKNNVSNKNNNRYINSKNIRIYIIIMPINIKSKNAKITELDFVFKFSDFF